MEFVMILTLLKWLGILLLVLFLIAFLLVCIVLCVPVRYHVQAVFGEKPRVCGYGSFFLHLVHISFRIEGGEQSHVIRILGIPLRRRTRSRGSGKTRTSARHRKKSHKSARGGRLSSERREERGKQNEESRSVQDEKAMPAGQETDVKKESQSVQEEGTMPAGQIQRTDQKKSSSQMREEQPEEVELTEWIEGGRHRKNAGQAEQRLADMKEPESYQEESEKPSEEEPEERNGFYEKIFERIRRFLLSIRARFVRIYKRLRKSFMSIWTGAGDIHQKASVSREILMDDNTPRLWELVWQSVWFLLRHCRPRRIQGRLIFGTGDPCTTGQILGAIGMCYAVVGSGVEITPDFERPVLDGKLGIWGRVRIGVVLYLAGRIWFSGEWKHFKEQIAIL